MMIQKFVDFSANFFFLQEFVSLLVDIPDYLIYNETKQKGGNLCH